MKFSGGFAPLDPHQGSALRCTLCSLLHIYFFPDSRFACGGMSDLIIVICFINFINFDFNFKFFLQCKEIYTLKLIVTLNFSLLCHDICFQSFFPPFFKDTINTYNCLFLLTSRFSRISLLVVYFVFFKFFCVQ